MPDKKKQFVKVLFSILESSDGQYWEPPNAHEILEDTSTCNTTIRIVSFKHFRSIPSPVYMQQFVSSSVAFVLLIVFVSSSIIFYRADIIDFGNILSTECK